MSLQQESRIKKNYAYNKKGLKSFNKKEPDTALNWGEKPI